MQIVQTTVDDLDASPQPMITAWARPMDQTLCHHEFFPTEIQLIMIIMIWVEE
jgi:hypothetical protein